MLILIMRTEKPEAELGLYLNDKKIDYMTWLAHRELSDTIHINIAKLLKRNKYDFDNIGGLIIYKGPGSFTGLRIGYSVANALAYSLSCPIVDTNEDDWIKQGLKLIKNNQSSKQVFPFYGAEVHISEPKK
jgi:tRNA threonylcarbamoyladenosine biosynthesis protein TsaB